MAPVPQSTSKKLLSWSNKNIPDDQLVVNDESKGREDDFHITVKFGLLENKPSEKLLEIVKNFRPFGITVGKTSRFKNGDSKGFDVIKSDIKSEGLHQLNKFICDACPYEDMYKTYHPHLTLAYVKPNSCNKLEGLYPLGESYEFVVKEVVFMGQGDEDSKRVKQTIKLCNISYKEHF